MSRSQRPGNSRLSEAVERETGLESAATDGVQALKLREEQLVARKSLRDVGEIEVRIEIDEARADWKSMRIARRWSSSTRQSVRLSASAQSHGKKTTTCW